MDKELYKLPLEITLYCLAFLVTGVVLGVPVVYFLIWYIELWIGG